MRDSSEFWSFSLVKNSGCASVGVSPSKTSTAMGIVAGLIVAGLVVWVMKAFSEKPSQDNDDSDDENGDNL